MTGNFVIDWFHGVWYSSHEVYTFLWSSGFDTFYGL